MGEMIGGIFGLAGVIIGAVITQGSTAWQKRKRHFAYWSALRAEVDICRNHASNYKKDQKAAPLYRLPVTAYKKGFPALLGDGAVSHSEAKTMLDFYNMVEQMNRGLERAGEMHLKLQDGGGDVFLFEEANRLSVKAEHLLDAHQSVRGVIDPHAKPSRWRRIFVVLSIIWAAGIAVLVAYGALTSVNPDNGWLGFAVMALVLGLVPPALLWGVFAGVPATWNWIVAGEWGKS